MFFFRKPALPAIRNFLDSQAWCDLTYAGIGATAAVPPVGYVVDHTHVRLGEGEMAFKAGSNALRQWQQFQLGWVEPCFPDTPIEVGRTVGILARDLGVWWLNACRIVYLVQDDGPIKRFGFAYGTLPDHAEMGEERFVIEWDRQQNAVFYDILAFSRPNSLPARLGYPWVRRVQRRFARDSAAAMQNAAKNG